MRRYFKPEAIEGHLVADVLIDHAGDFVLVIEKDYFADEDEG